MIITFAWADEETSNELAVVLIADRVSDSTGLSLNLIIQEIQGSPGQRRDSSSKRQTSGSMSDASGSQSSLAVK